jgi:cytochrome c556
MKKFIIAVSAIAFATTAAFADVIADRKAVMKENGKQVGVLVKMVQGEADFDAAAVMAALTRLNENVQAIDVAASFPPGSDKGDTTASPKIWEDMAGFQAAVDKFKAVTAEAAAAPAQDQEGLTPAYEFAWKARRRRRDCGRRWRAGVLVPDRACSHGCRDRGSA